MRLFVVMYPQLIMRGIINWVRRPADRVNSLIVNTPHQKQLHVIQGDAIKTTLAVKISGLTHFAKKTVVHVVNFEIMRC